MYCEREAANQRLKASGFAEAGPPQSSNLVDQLVRRGLAWRRTLPRMTVPTICTEDGHLAQSDDEAIQILVHHWQPVFGGGAISDEALDQH